MYNQSGTNITALIADSGNNGVPAEDPTGHWEAEEELDVEWAHAMAPGAKIDVIEVNDDANWPTNLLAGDKLAAGLPGVSVVSNSWGLYEWSGETAYDSSTFVTPNGHTGVTFLTASNDNGANVYPSPPSNPAPSAGNDGYYPATSPNVVSVGGTQLTLNSNTYGSETAWSFPAPASTVDNGSSSYTQSGSWSSQSGGFSGTYSTAAGGSSSSAVWTIADYAGEHRLGNGALRDLDGAARATRPTRLTRSTTAPRRPGPSSGRSSSIRAQAPLGTALRQFPVPGAGGFLPDADGERHRHPDRGAQRQFRQQQSGRRCHRQRRGLGKHRRSNFVRIGTFVPSSRSRTPGSGQRPTWPSTPARIPA